MKITVPLILFGTVAGVSSFVPKLADFLLWALVGVVGLAALVGLVMVLTAEAHLHWECVRPNPSSAGLPPPVYHPSSPHARRQDEKEAAGE